MSPTDQTQKASKKACTCSTHPISLRAASFLFTPLTPLSPSLSTVHILHHRRMDKHGMIEIPRCGIRKCWKVHNGNKCMYLKGWFLAVFVRRGILHVYDSYSRPFQTYLSVGWLKIFLRREHFSRDYIST